MSQTGTPSASFRTGLTTVTPTPSRSLRRPSTLLLLQPTELSVIVATDPPRNKFDFDAPQFTDFTKPQYRRQKQLLEQVVLRNSDENDHGTDNGNNHTRGGWTIFPILGEIEEHSEEDSTWFERHHFEHEPSTPVSPTGPLITSQANSSVGGGASSENEPVVRATPRSTYLSESSLHTSNNIGGGGSATSSDIHSSGMHSTGYGKLRNMKARRILVQSTIHSASPLHVAPSSVSAALLSSVVSDDRRRNRSSLATSLFSDELSSTSAFSFVKSPTTAISLARRGGGGTCTSTGRWDVKGHSYNTAIPSTPTPLRPDDEVGEELDLLALDGEHPSQTMANLKSSLPPIPSTTNWSSIPATPPMLAAHLLLLEDSTEVDGPSGEGAEKKRTNPPSTSAVRTDKQLPRRIALGGGASRVLRIPDSTQNVPLVATSSLPMLTFENNLLKNNNDSLRRFSPIKRVKVDARFCPVPLPPRSRPASPTLGNNHEGEPSATTVKKPQFPTSRKADGDRPVKLDELKKLLADHNQRIRPHLHNNITRRRF